MTNSYELEPRTLRRGDHVYLEGVAPVTVVDIADDGTVHHVPGHIVLGACCTDALSRVDRRAEAVQEALAGFTPAQLRRIRLVCLAGDGEQRAVVTRVLEDLLPPHR